MVTRSAIPTLNECSNRKDKLMRIIIIILATIISLLGIACAAEAPPNTAVESYANACATINQTAVAQWGASQESEERLEARKIAHYVTEWDALEPPPPEVARYHEAVMTVYLDVIARPDGDLFAGTIQTVEDEWISLDPDVQETLYALGCIEQRPTGYDLFTRIARPEED